ncbi:hypothetical protein ACFWGN_17985 [Oerskovia sp. NPDC060338]|uniref:hypothetical protein n=1 Tax=Oerskovia sp. NPDC060338 TaxID=3347100 RepID=UPI003664AFC3
MVAIALRGKVLAERLHDVGANTNVEVAKVLGLNDGTISRVLAGKSDPGNKFIAAVLRNVPVAFEEVFVVVDREGDEAKDDARSASDEPDPGHASGSSHERPVALTA